ncbi:MAG: leucine-rich repeat domain-containing protein, partial [Firmicutes bacterium]|nr:leucine-rich repeat domain-containing protein [Bacillota bacterium]
DGVLFNKAGTILIWYPTGRSGSYDIPTGVTGIGEQAFACCLFLTSITVPSGVTSIARSAFYWCSYLTSITIPSSVANIETGAFFGCDSLTVYYGGTDITAWDTILIYDDYSNGGLLSATRYYYSETFQSGCWRYVGGVPTLW